MPTWGNAARYRKIGCYSARGGRVTGLRARSEGNNRLICPPRRGRPGETRWLERKMSVILRSGGYCHAIWKRMLRRAAPLWKSERAQLTRLRTRSSRDHGRPPSRAFRDAPLRAGERELAPTFRYVRYSKGRRNVCDVGRAAPPKTVRSPLMRLGAAPCFRPPKTRIRFSASGIYRTANGLGCTNENGGYSKGPTRHFKSARANNPPAPAPLLRACIGTRAIVRGRTNLFVGAARACTFEGYAALLNTHFHSYALRTAFAKGLMNDFCASRLPGSRRAKPERCGRIPALRNHE